MSEAFSARRIIANRGDNRARTGNHPWGESHTLEAEEEDYFNNDDDDEPDLVPFTRPDVTLPNNIPRRKRLRVNITHPSRSVRQPNAPSPQASPLSSLLDYDEDDDIPSPVGRQPDSPRFLREEESRVPKSPVLVHRQIQILPAKPPEPSDPEDDLLEALVTNGQTKHSPSSSAPQPTGSAGKAGMPLAMRPREKRRRTDEDDDDELLERLASKGKRHSVDSRSEQPEAPSKVSPFKNGDEGPKKLKLKFGASSRAVAASPPTATPSSRNSTKDGDEG